MALHTTSSPPEKLTKKNGVRIINQNIILTLLMNMMAVGNMVSVYASDNGILDGIDGASGTVVDRLILTFNTSIFPIALVIILLGILFSGTNERLLGAFKTAFKWAIIVFLALNCFRLLVNTCIWIAGLINGVGGSTTAVSGPAAPTR